jgi:hypothetical protein
MPFTWRATYRFTYPLLDRPVRMGQVDLYPSPPGDGGGCVHFFEFDTATGDSEGQRAARERAEQRLQDLFDLAGLVSEYMPKAKLLSLALVGTTSPLETLSRGGINFPGNEWPGQPYVPPGEDPGKFRAAIETLAPIYDTFTRLDGLCHAAVSRALRWVYRANDRNELPEDRLTYYWIAFNSLYECYHRLTQASANWEGEHIQNFETALRAEVGPLSGQGPSRAMDLLASANLTLRGRKCKDVSTKLAKALETHRPDTTQMALLCVYSVRNQIFHGGLLPGTPAQLVRAAIEILEPYLRLAIPPFIYRCDSAAPALPSKA